MTAYAEVIRSPCVVFFASLTALDARAFVTVDVVHDNEPPLRLYGSHAVWPKTARVSDTPIETSGLSLIVEGDCRVDLWLKIDGVMWLDSMTFIGSEPPSRRRVLIDIYDGKAVVKNSGAANAG